MGKGRPKKKKQNTKAPSTLPTPPTPTPWRQRRPASGAPCHRRSSTERSVCSSLRSAAKFRIARQASSKLLRLQSPKVPCSRCDEMPHPDRGTDAAVIRGWSTFVQELLVAHVDGCKFVRMGQCCKDEGCLLFVQELLVACMDGHKSVRMDQCVETRVVYFSRKNC